MTDPITLPTNTALPEIEPTADPSNLLVQLLAEQQQMTAVDTFSHWQDGARPSIKLYHALLPTAPLQHGQQYAFEVDLDACSGCKACVVACHTLNGLDERETWRKVGTLHSTSSSLPVVQHVTTACHHCIDPGCLNGCPVLAYEKDPVTGIVRHLDDQCFGCKYCLMMCPYEVPQYSASLGIVRKCDMCTGRLEEGEAPACVQACPNHAIKIAAIEVKSAGSATLINGQRLVSTAPENRITQPTTQFVSKRLSDTQSIPDLVSRESVMDAVQSGHEPLVAMLVLTQASVGAWCVVAAAVIFDLWPTSVVQAVSISATVVGFVGVQSALLHLGRPWLAFRSFLGWRRSWLSREAIAFGMYLGATSAAVASCSFSDLRFLAPITSFVASAVGCASVLCSAMIYIATRRELWSATRTLLEFTSTTIGLGLGIASLWTWDTSTAALLAGSVACCTIAMVPKLMDWQAASQTDLLWNSFSGRSGRLLRGELRTVFVGAVGCLMTGVAVVASTLLLDITLLRTVLIFTGVVALVVSHLLVRWLYFASVVFARMPGAST